MDKKVETLAAEIGTLAECLAAMASAQLNGGREICAVTMSRLAEQIDAAAMKIIEHETAWPAPLAA